LSGAESMLFQESFEKHKGTLWAAGKEFANVKTLTFNLRFQPRSNTLLLGYEIHSILLRK